MPSRLVTKKIKNKDKKQRLSPPLSPFPPFQPPLTNSPPTPMADSERMEAVKRAYAEIILNTAAESAARILASERKTLRFQQSLAMAKQEAVDMMVRMKSLMDSKIQEAETRNTLHARRIQELESQLQQAEGTILSLRNELERERNNNHKNNNNKSTQVGSIPTQEENKENTSNCFMNSNHDDSSCSARTGTSTGTGSAQDITDTGTDCEAKIRMRNGCTQRIIALVQSKDPKGDQIFGNKKQSTKKEPEGKNGGDSKLSLRRGPPRKSRSKFNYVKISKFGMNIDKDEASGKKAKKGLVKCTENDESEGNNCNEKENGQGSDFEEALLGLELIADKIGKEDKLVPATQEATEDLITENPKSQENVSTVNKPGSDELETPIVNLKPKIEETLVPITEQEGLRSIKYTFMRKRKRGPLENNNNNTENKEEENKEGNSDGNKEECPNGNNDNVNKKKTKKNMKRNNNSKDLKGVEKRSLRLKNKNERMLLDSPRSNRRMVQVARQLVSLSARKW